MKTLRRLHLYLGCFFAPLLLFYVITGWYQTFNPNRNKSLGEKGDWISNLTQIHVDQIYPNKDPGIYYAPALFRGLVVLMSISLIVTVGLGIYLAFRSSRKRWPVWVSLALGVAAPILFLWLGQRR